MSDPVLAEAIREAYAVAPGDEVVLHTLEIRHPDFDAPIRVVRNYPDDQSWLGHAGARALLEGLDAEHRARVGLVARLEDSAPVEPGQLVAWIALAFDFDLPEISSTAAPEITITLDNVGRELSDALDRAATSAAVTEVTYRPYLASDLEGPQMDPPLTLDLREVEATPLRVTGRAGVLRVGDRAFPNMFYTSDLFPGLIR